MSYKRKKYDKHNIKKLFNKTKNSCLKGAYYDENKGYTKFSLSDNKNKLKKFVKRVANKKVRKTKGVANNRSRYKKIYPIRDWF